MPHFIYYKQGSADAAVDRCVKIVRPRQGLCWNSAEEEMQDAIATLTEQFIDLTYSALLHGYPVTIPASLPSGDYDFLFFDGAAAAMTETTEPEAGYGITWNKEAGIFSAPVERMADRIK